MKLPKNEQKLPKKRNLQHKLPKKQYLYKRKEHNRAGKSDRHIKKPQSKKYPKEKRKTLILQGKVAKK
jgi:hypothetical protein